MFFQDAEEVGPVGNGGGGASGDGGIDLGIPPILDLPLPPIPPELPVEAPTPPVELPPPTPVETQPLPELPPPTVTPPPIEPQPPLEQPPPSIPAPPPVEPPSTTLPPIKFPPIIFPPRLPPAQPPPTFTQPSGPTLGGTTSPTITGLPPITISVPAPSVTESVTVTPTPITVIVNNLETIGADVVSSISSAITGGLGGLENEFSGFLSDALGEFNSAFGTIFSGIGSILSGIISAIANKIGDILSSIGSGIAALVKRIADAIIPIIKAIGDTIASIIKGIASEITKVLEALKADWEKGIIPLIRAIAQSYTTVAALIRAIQRDVHLGIKGFLQIPGQISDAINGIEGILYRLWQEIRPDLKTDAQSNIDYGATHGVGKTLHDLFGGFSTPASGTELNPIYATQDQLTTLCARTDIDQVIRSNTQPSVDAPKWIQEIVSGLLRFVMSYYNMLGTMRKIGEAGAQEANANCPIDLLPTGELINAWRRGFLTLEQIQSETQKQGINSDRLKVLTDLSFYINSSDELVDLLFKGLITDDVFQAGHTALGYTQEQAQAAKAASQHYPTQDEIILWLKRGQIDQATAASLLSKLRYSDAQAQTVLATYMQYVPTRFRADLDGLLTASGQGWLQDSMLTPVPQEVLDAGVRDGIEAGHVRLIWQNHWTLPPYIQMVQSYFRGFRTYTEVLAAMISQNIPREIHDELIQNARPLIPYRSIPSFVKAGAMSDADAIQELTRHGFDTQHINWILALLTSTKSTTKTAAATTAHALSLTNAKALFDDGAITKDQYVQILEQHNFTPDLASTFADVEEISAHIKARRQLIVDQLAEVSAGVTTVDSATTVIANAGGTDAEIARFHVQAAKALRVAQKHPTEAELTKFAKAQLITQTQYRSELSVQGWNTQWVDAFAGLLYSSPTAVYPGA